MRIHFICAALLAFTPLAAEARSAFFVQLGTAPDEKQAEETWERLKKDYPAPLAGLEFSPRIVSAADSGGQEVRIQAGPARSRDAAQRICAGLSAKDIECFLVETAVFDGAPSIPARSVAPALTPPETVAETATPTAPETADAPAPSGTTETVIAPKSSGGWLSFLFGDDEKADEPAAPQAVEAAADDTLQADAPPGSITIPPAEAAAADAAVPLTDAPPLPWASETTTAKRVDVAEAIPVPLSADRPDTAGEAPARGALSSAIDIPEDVRWLQIVGFINEQQAYDFSETLHVELQDRGALRMRINRPLFARAASRRAVTLTVGPVSTAETVRKICELAAQQENALQCAGSAEQTDVSTNLFTRRETPPVPVPAPEAPAAEAPAQPSFFADHPANRFYALLGTWRTRGEAMRRWDALKQQHAGLLKDRQPDVSAPVHASINARPGVRLRVGPFMLRDEAENLCARLSARGASCITVPE